VGRGCGRSGVGVVDTDCGLRVGIGTESEARVGVGPVPLSEEMFSPTGIDPGKLVPFRGAKGS
jgi:hypothetical protein